MTQIVTGEKFKLVKNNVCECLWSKNHFRLVLCMKTFNSSATIIPLRKQLGIFRSERNFDVNLPSTVYECIHQFCKRQVNQVSSSYLPSAFNMLPLFEQAALWQGMKAGAGFYCSIASLCLLGACAPQVIR